MSIDVSQYEGVRRHNQMIQRGIYPPVQELAGGMYTLVMIKSVFHSLAVIVNSSKWGSARVSGESGLREKLIDLWINVSKPPPWPWWRPFLTVVKFWMLGVREYKLSLIPDSLPLQLYIALRIHLVQPVCYRCDLHWITEWWRDPRRKLWL